jgi:large subunit ribosomal protein L10
MPNAQNVESLAAIKAELEGVVAVWVVDYRGLTVKEFQQLRRDIRAAQGTMTVCKNTLMKRALADLEMPNMDSILEGPSAFVFAKEDAVAPAKALKDFASQNQNLELKGGIMDGEFQDVDAFKTIASLPSKDQLLGQIASSLTAVASQLAIAIGEMSEKEAA